MSTIATVQGIDAPPLVYQSVNRAVLDCIAPTATRVLDVGCGSGVFGAALKARRPCRVVGVTYSEAEARQARTRLDEVIVADLDQFDTRLLGRYDCIVCSHVLEHLQAPHRLLRGLHDCLAPGGSLIVALPNVLFWKQRLQFMLGRFRYTEGGLMDRTHLRFFDWDTAAELVESAGFKLQLRSADGVLPLARLLGPVVARSVNRRALAALPGLLGVQFVLCGARPDVPASSAA